MHTYIYKNKRIVLASRDSQREHISHYDATVLKRLALTRVASRKCETIERLWINFTRVTRRVRRAQRDTTLDGSASKRENAFLSTPRAQTAVVLSPFARVHSSFISKFHGRTSPRQADIRLSEQRSIRYEMRDTYQRKLPGRDSIGVETPCLRKQGRRSC